MQSAIVFLSKDIFFWPVVKAAAQEINSQIVIISRLDDPKLSGINHEHVSTCLIDLAAVEVASLASLVEGLRDRFPNARNVAFGSHVHEARLASAVESGCNVVISRGQFSANPIAFLQPNPQEPAN